MVRNNSKERHLPVSYFDYIKDRCTYPNFPKDGVNFIDIFPILRQTGCNEFNDFVANLNSDIVLIPEARGFLFAQSFDPRKEVFLRKEGKLPGTDIHQIKAPKEYGESIFEFRESDLIQIINNFNLSKNCPVTIIFFGDVLATGQTAKAVYNYFSDLTIQGYTFGVTSCVFFLELSQLEGRELLNKNTSVYSFITYNPD